MPARYDVLGVGNAIMDVIAPVPDAFLDLNAIEKGAMTLIDEPRALDLHSKFTSESAPKEIAGGSGANTLAGIAMMGVAGAYVGKVGEDEIGQRFVKSMHDAGLDFDTPPLKGRDATARCLVAVTPDGERSMNTFLGASVKFDAKDIVREQVEGSRIIYMEGYLFDKDPAKKAFVKAAEIAQAANRTVSLTLSDSFCVERHRESFRQLVEHHTDILFANESELLSLYRGLSFGDALNALAAVDKIACITRSEKGSIILEGGNRHLIPAASVDHIKDATGAGDQYAAGVLAGHVTGMSWIEAGHLGSRAAAEVISHYGARP
ncbi:MAG: adenosine kinase [Hyphomonadaceae bacterium]|nr:adenosine kinase [Hyphomonadaceae bacterium]MBC6413006.1 adenosine kinase [Hyphomonadaceae bacterium]